MVVSILEIVHEERARFLLNHPLTKNTTDMNSFISRFLLVAALAALLALSLWACAKLMRENLELKDRHERNIAALYSDIETWKYKDSVSAARCNALELKASEAERLCSDLRAQCERLGVRIKDVKTFATNEVAYHDTIFIPVPVSVPSSDNADISPRDTCFNSFDKWGGVSVCLAKTGGLNGFSVSYSVFDTIRSVVHVSYRKKFLWWRWKPEFKATSTCSNPHAVITDAAAVVVSD